MIQKYTILFALCFAIQISWAQKPQLKEANKAFKANDFYTAITNYKQIENPDSQTRLNLADSYYYLGKMTEAANIYEMYFANDTESDKDALLRYADAEKANDNYEKANEILSKYTDKSVNIKQKLAENEQNLPVLFHLEILNAQSEHAEFGPALYRDKLVFSSDRNSASPVYARTQQPFLDFYTATISGTELSGIEPFSEAINTALHEGNITFTKDGKTAYFTRTNDDYKRINGVKIAVLQLFKADFIDGKWQHVEKLSLNDNAYSLAHPALSPDDKTLYFTSDMQGGFGGGDIYKSERLGENEFGTPVNLGPAVNSEMQEQFPYISPDGNLYFASDRFSGLGGLDLYRSDLKNDEFAEAYNLGSSINSGRDDFSIVFDHENTGGYFSSNRTGTDKLYNFVTQDVRKRQVSGIVINAETKKPLKDAKIDLYEGKNSIKQLETGADGLYNLFLKPDTAYAIEVKMNGFFTKNHKLNLSSEDPLNIQLDLPLQPLKDVLTERKIDNIYFDFDKYDIRPEAEKVLDGLAVFMHENEHVNITIASHTDASGSADYNKKLSEKRAQATKNYLAKKGISAARILTTAFGENDLLVNTPLKGKEAREEKNRRSEFKIVKD